MADRAVYKQRNRRDRSATIETDFSRGMMWTNGAVDEGYLRAFVNCSFDKETKTVVPRPGLRVSGCVFPGMSMNQDEDFFDDNVVIHATKSCVENGVTYEQTVIGRLDDNDNTKGLIWVLTSNIFLDYAALTFTGDYTGPVSFSDYSFTEEPHICKFFSAESPKIHDIFLESDDFRRIETPVGCFAYGNSFYFFGEDGEGNDGLFRTVFDPELNPPRYKFEAVDPKTPTVSEAVSYGYNVLRNEATYTFTNKHSIASGNVQFDGILPYESGSSHTKLVMTPKKGQNIDLVCYYDAHNGDSYDIVWESRESTASDWTPLKTKETITFNNNTVLSLDGFLAQDKEIMVRVVAYIPDTDEVVKAIVVGFDFTVANYGTANAFPQQVYNLATATGVVSFTDRIVAWGLPADPTILFISDYNEPSYFPYPNNIVVFDEPIIHCVEFMGKLIVFTVDKIYQVTQSEDAISWKSEVIQTHLRIDPWDKHLIKTVRNMLYFKSGNYYYMMVPKARSITGELTVAPITTPITDFFDRFSVNVEEVVKYTYGYTNRLELLTYYNFLDYDEIHNIYAFKFHSLQSVVNPLAILHFDVIYNTNDRTWKIWLFEAPNIVFPYRQEATRPGTLATTSLVNFVDIGEGSITGYSRIIQLYNWDNMLVRSCYIPHHCDLTYNPDNATARIVDLIMHVSEEYAFVSGEKLIFKHDRLAWVDHETLFVQDDSDFYVGYSKTEILQNIRKVYLSQDEYYTFKNYQFIDTGYRNDSLQIKKRYREVQFQINNLDQKNLNFGMDYILDGSPRRVLYKYEVSQMIDEMDPEYGIVYVNSDPLDFGPFPHIDFDMDHIDITNQWTIDQNLTPEVSLWKVRVSLSGKGYAPRLRLYSRNEKRFELMNINWISKVMHMR
ncbi:MAG: hypothetical protein J6Y02_15145 [Pseudobutyrivibrio sp.]|nr:hypothetical protein [Pseudobutyrivibrio sp.]